MNSWGNNLKTFKEILNELKPDIKLTAEESRDCISYLDILLTRLDEVIITDVYYKPTNAHQYLHFNSCHPWHTKITIPYDLARKICTIYISEPVKIQSRRRGKYCTSSVATCNHRVDQRTAIIILLYESATKWCRHIKLNVIKRSF